MAGPTSQRPTNPEYLDFPPFVSSEVNFTCMYPEDDMYTRLELTDEPDNDAMDLDEEHDVGDEEEEHE